jgi:hypothetical protein
VTGHQLAEGVRVALAGEPDQLVVRHTVIREAAGRNGWYRLEARGGGSGHDTDGLKGRHGAHVEARGQPWSARYPSFSASTRIWARYFFSAARPAGASL